MAYRRSLSIKANLLTNRFKPCLGYITNDDERRTQPASADICRPKSNSLLHRGYHNYRLNQATTGSRDSGMPPLSMPTGLGSSVCRYSSATAEEGSDKVESLSDIAGTVVDNGMELAASQASVVSEVATAAADSFYPIAALQYFIDGVHTFTALNWWASIALTTILIRGLTVPILINQLKCTTKLTVQLFFWLANNTSRNSKGVGRTTYNKPIYKEDDITKIHEDISG